MNNNFELRRNCPSTSSGSCLHGGMPGYHPTDRGRVPLQDMKGGATWGWQTKWRTHRYPPR